ncbi:MAG TPA: N-acetyltransferase family protein [Rhodospirillales bacterium]|nr:N-acetyltransferase family protein [Rhodospirillales bacterium]
MTVSVRPATVGDMVAVQEIYADHVLHGLASFEEIPPDVAEIMGRFKALREDDYPFTVGVVNGTVKGFAYAGPYRPRPAYLHTVENSVYIAPDAYRQGIGGQLLTDLIDRCTQRGLRQMVAIIGDSDNTASIALHARHGFVHRATVASVGFKLGRWVDQVIMQRALGDGDQTLPGAPKG